MESTGILSIYYKISLLNWALKKQVLRVLCDLCALCGLNLLGSDHRKAHKGHKAHTKKLMDLQFFRPLRLCSSLVSSPSPLGKISISRYLGLWNHIPQFPHISKRLLPLRRGFISGHFALLDFHKPVPGDQLQIRNYCAKIQACTIYNLRLARASFLCTKLQNLKEDLVLVSLATHDILLRC